MRIDIAAVFAAVRLGGRAAGNLGLEGCVAIVSNGAAERVGSAVFRKLLQKRAVQAGIGLGVIACHPLSTALHVQKQLVRPAISQDAALVSAHLDDSPQQQEFCLLLLLMLLCSARVRVSESTGSARDFAVSPVAASCGSPGLLRSNLLLQQERVAVASPIGRAACVIRVALTEAARHARLIVKLNIRSRGRFAGGQ